MYAVAVHNRQTASLGRKSGVTERNHISSANLHFLHVKRRG